MDVWEVEEQKEGQVENRKELGKVLLENQFELESALTKTRSFFSI